MKNLKNTLIISSYVLLVALFFSGGYALGKIGAKENNTSTPMPTMNAVAANADSEVKSPVYKVIAEDGVLKIYRCIGDEKTVITSEKISESVFPTEDIEELRKGVEFERLEGAQQMFENFVS